MYMNEGATATLAVESGDRGFRLKPDKKRMETRAPRPCVVRSERGPDLPGRVDEVEVSAPPEVTPDDVAAAAFDGVDSSIFTGALSGLMSSDAAARALAAKAMSCIRHELSGRALVAQLARETSAGVRAECINALTRLEAKDGLPAVENALDDEHAAVRLAAVRGTYRLAGREGAGLLVRMLHDACEDVRRRAATCLGWLEHKPAAVDLLPLLADPHAFVRGAAVDALANLGSSRAVPGITELLKDPAESVRKRAHLALQTIIRITAIRTDTRRYQRTLTSGRISETFPEERGPSTDAPCSARPFWHAGAPALVHRFVA